MVVVFGLGFVGLTTALGFADKGYQVYGVDVNKERLETIKKGEIPFYEPELKEALERTQNKNFFLTEDLETAIKESTYIFYCVGTPYGENGEADLTYLFKAIDETLPYIKDTKFRVLITKSTIPPGTTKERIVPYINKKGFEIGVNLGVANNPEFLREGKCWDDFMNPDRIVLGCNDQGSETLLKKLYQVFDAPIFSVSHNTGEYIKYLSNTLLATLISYSNEMSIVADHIGDIEVKKAFQILHQDKRWGNAAMTSYVYPGCGYGGYCLPKDTNALYSQSKNKGYEPHILKQVIQTNEKMPQSIIEKITKKVSKISKIGILGLAFKPNSDDVRESPAIKIIEGLLKGGYHNIYAFDPIAIKEYQKHYHQDITFLENYEDICKNSDFLVILTAWEMFSNLRSDDSHVIDCRFML